MSFKAPSLQEILQLPKRRYGVPVFLCVVFLQANLIVMLTLHLYRNHRGLGTWTLDDEQNRTMMVTQTTNTTTTTTNTAAKITTTTATITTTTKLKDIAKLNSKGSSSHTGHDISRTRHNSSVVKSSRVTTPRPLYDVNKCEKAAKIFLRSYTSECERSTRKNKKQNGHDIYSLPMCPCVPPNLHGRINLTFEKPLIGEIELQHLELEQGGRWRPHNCTARQKVALVIPFRDREEHLRIFLHHIHPILQRQLLDYTIFVVEQKTLSIFNKAMMMNVGFVEASKLVDFDCFVFHDIDLLPEDDRNIYTCSGNPRHMAPFLRKWQYILPYKGLFGGAIALRPEHFRRSNGFSNAFFGWGGEDDDMYRRVKAVKLAIVRYPSCVARYTMIKHKSDKRNPMNRNSGVAWKYRPKTYQKEGLSSLHYKSVEIERRPLYTWMYVDIDKAAKFKWSVSNSSRSIRSSLLLFALLTLLTCNTVKSQWLTVRLR